MAHKLTAAKHIRLREAILDGMESVGDFPAEYSIVVLCELAVLFARILATNDDEALQLISTCVNAFISSSAK